MTPTEQAARIQEIKNSTEIVNMGIVDDLGDETVAWAGRSDFGTMGWFVGTFHYYMGSPFCPSLSPSIFFDNKKDAIDHLCSVKLSTMCK